MKRFSAFITALFAMAIMAYGQVISGSLTAGINLLSTTGVRIKGLELFDTSGSANTIILYDNDSASSTNRARPAYQAVTQYSTNVVMTFTNFAGVVQSSTNTVLATVTSTVAATTNEARRVYQVVVPGNSTVTIAPTTPLGTTYGFQIRTVGTALYNASYNTLP
jgi:hypothetical protein